MIARMLQLCGLYLGEESDLHEAQPDNPDGFCEHKEFHALNDRILGAFDGAWDTIPHLPKDWLRLPKIDVIREDAKKLIDSFCGHDNWGWKDPRNSITLAFWLELIPDLKVIVPVRNPLDVAASLEQRGYASQIFSVSLWRDYMGAVDENKAGQALLYTHYSTYFSQPGAELDRLLEYCELRPDPDQWERALSVVKPRLRHSQATLFDLFACDVEFRVIQQYITASYGCMPGYEPFVRSEALSSYGLQRDKGVRRLSSELRSTEAKLSKVEGALCSETNAAIALETSLTDSRAEVEQLKANLLSTQRFVETLEADLAAHKSDLETIQSSPSWPISRRLDRIKLLRLLFQYARRQRLRTAPERHSA